MPIVSLIRRVHQATLNFECQLMPKHCPTLPISAPEDDFMINEYEKATPLSAAIRYAASIHLNSLQRRVPFISNENQALVEELRLCLLSLPQGGGLEVETEFYVWLCFTGAAAARRKKTWFLAKVGPVVMSLGRTQLDLFKTGLVRFCGILQNLTNVEREN